MVYVIAEAARSVGICATFADRESGELAEVWWVSLAEAKTRGRPSGDRPVR
jgi:hypothetical protein